MTRKLDSRTSSLPALMATTLLALAALSCGGEARLGHVDAALVQANGVKLNGVKLNGVKLNGVKLNGVKLNGVKLNGTTLSGVSLLGGQLASGNKTGAAFVGARLNGALSDGTILSMRIDAASAAPVPDADVWNYRVSYKEPVSKAWLPLCVSDAGTTLDAVAVAGSWNYDTGVAGGGAHTDDATVFTFGCSDSAIAKCVFAGYKPWSSGPGFSSLSGHHQACTRMIRADYCGDGSTWTSNGRPINLYDGIGVQTDTRAWPREAEWTVGGAACMLAERIVDFSAVPPCLASKFSFTCGDTAHFSQSVLLVSEVGQITVTAPDGTTSTVNF